MSISLIDVIIHKYFIIWSIIFISVFSFFMYDSLVSKYKQFKKLDIDSEIYVPCFFGSLFISCFLTLGIGLLENIFGKYIYYIIIILASIIFICTVVSLLIKTVIQYTIMTDSKKEKSNE